MSALPRFTLRWWGIETAVAIVCTPMAAAALPHCVILTEGACLCRQDSFYHGPPERCKVERVANPRGEARPKASAKGSPSSDRAR
jgi:hypothetical protein